MSEKDYYSILGVNKDATSDVIKKAYRKKALECHPDKTGGDDSDFKLVNEAYDILGSDKRHAYDNPNPFGNINVDSMFDMFGRMNVNMNNVHVNTRPIERRSYTHNLNIPLKSVHFGLTKTLKINIKKDCLDCLINCTKCNGNGIITNMIQIGPFMQQMQQHCHICNGTGTVKKVNLSCSFCGGKNERIEEQMLKVDIPIGVTNGYTICFPGLGEQGKKRGEKSGDFNVQIIIDKDPYFEREGNDLIFKCKISLKESIIGKCITVPHFDESINVNVNIFGIINPKKRYHLKNRGLKDGDLIFVFEICYPERLFDNNSTKLLSDVFAQVGL
jgi:DnaJ-class molecular chaperone